MRQQIKYHHQYVNGVEALIRDFQSETGVNLVWRYDSENREDETAIGYGDSISYHLTCWREAFAVIDSFWFTIDGVVVSGNMPKRTTYGSIDVGTDEILEADETALLAAIQAVCGFDFKERVAFA